MQPLLRDARLAEGHSRVRFEMMSSEEKELAAGPSSSAMSDRGEPVGSRGGGGTARATGDMSLAPSAVDVVPWLCARIREAERDEDSFRVGAEEDFRLSIVVSIVLFFLLIGSLFG